jgi:hypothetical protein
VIAYYDLGSFCSKNEPARAGGGQLTVGTFLLG